MHGSIPEFLFPNKMLKEKPVKKNNRFLKRFAHRRTVRLAAYFLLLIAVVASLADVLSNEKPLYVNRASIFCSFIEWICRYSQQ